MEGYFELNSHIVIVNNKTEKIINTYFESSKTNNWVSDAVALKGIEIDTAPYQISKKSRAFGIRVNYYGMSSANPYSNTKITLFIKSDKSLKKIVNNYDIMHYVGEWDTNCIGEFIDEKKVFIISKKKTNGYFDILVKNIITETKSRPDENNDCIDTEVVTTVETTLTYNNGDYK